MKTANQTESGKLATILLYLTITLSICFGLTSTVDFFNAPRFLVLCVGLLSLCICYLVNQKTQTIQIDSVLLAFAGYSLFYFISYFEANCKSEALFSSEKIFVSFLFFIFSSLFFRVKIEDKLVNISKLFIFLFALFFIFSLFQFLKLKNNDFNSVYKITSLSGHKNLYSCFLFLCIPFFIYGHFMATKTWTYAFRICLFLILISILFLQTRAVWLGLVVSSTLFLFFILIKNKSKVQLWVPKKMAIYSAIFLGSLLFITSILHYFNHLDLFLARLDFSTYSATYSVNERLLIWEKTIDLIKEHFWVGVGAGNWQFEYLKFSIGGIMDAMGGSTFQRPHNDFLWIWVETGIFGFISFLLLFGIPMAISIRKFVKESSSKADLLEIMVVCFLIGFFIVSLFDFPKERIELLVMSFLLLSFLYSKNIHTYKLIFEIKLTYLILLFIPILLLCILTAGFRIKGENYTVKIYKAKTSQNAEAIIRNCDKAFSLFYEVDPASMPLSWYKGIAYTQVNDYENGCSEFDRAYQLSRYNHIINNNIGVCKLRSGNIEMAKKYFEESIRINPVYDEPILNLVVIYFNEKNYQKALKYTNMADPDLQRTQRYLKLIKPLVNN